MRAPVVMAAVVLLQAAALASASGADESAFQCALKDATGIPEADAQTATRLLCDELRRASSGRGAFELSLGTLGKLVLVTAAREDTHVSVTVQVEGLEEIPVAAARIAKALAEGRSFASTERVDNLVTSETREPLTKKGSVKFSLGIGDIETPGHGAHGANLLLGLSYNTARFALPAEMRFGWDNSDYGGKQMDLFSISVGGRAYLSTRDISPFAGAGLGYLHLSASEGSWDSSTYFDGARSGVVPYLEGGVEFLRTHRGRLTLQARVDFPTGSLKSPGHSDYDPYSGYPGTPVPEQSRYVVPVSIGLSVTF